MTAIGSLCSDELRERLALIELLYKVTEAYARANPPVTSELAFRKSKDATRELLIDYARISIALLHDGTSSECMEEARRFEASLEHEAAAASGTDTLQTGSAAR